MPNTEARPVFKNLAQAFSSPQASVNNTTIEHSVTNSENEIIHVPVGDTIPYRNHSFDCTEEDIPPDFLASIRANGVQQPALARINPDGKYEIIFGHKRRLATIIEKIPTLPVFIKDLSDEEADIIMVDSNKQRPKIKPSEFARSTKVKYEAKKRQGTRTDLIKPISDYSHAEATDTVLSAYDIVANEENITPSQVRRWVECGNLPLDLMRFMDTGNFAYSTGALLQTLPTATLTMLTSFLQENPKTKIKGKHIELLKNVTEPSQDSVNLVFSEDEQEKKIATVSIPKTVLQELFDDTELDTMDENAIVDFIRKAIAVYRKGEPNIE